MKRRIKLTESSLYSIIKESVKRILNEVDLKDFPYDADFPTRNNWWKGQMDKDFPGHNIKNSRDYQRDYYDLQSQREEEEKANEKKAREQAKQQRLQQAKQEKEAKRSDKRQLFLKALEYTLFGDETFLSDDQYYNLGDENWGEEEWNNWSDGIEVIPLMIGFRDKVKAKIFGVGFSNSIYDRSLCSNYDYVVEWSVEWANSEDGNANISIGIVVDDRKNSVYCEIIYCDNEMVNKSYSSKLITKHINYQVSKNMKTILDKEQRWSSYDFGNG